MSRCCGLAWQADCKRGPSIRCGLWIAHQPVLTRHSPIIVPIHHQSRHVYSRQLLSITHSPLSLKRASCRTVALIPTCFRPCHHHQRRHCVMALAAQNTAGLFAGAKPCHDRPGEDFHVIDNRANLSQVTAERTHGRTFRDFRGHEGHDGSTMSRKLTQLYTLSYLVFFAIIGTLARLGLTALTHYVDTPVLFTTLWANFGGSLVMGFLAEDRMLFRREWGTATYDRVLAQAKKQDEEEGGEGSGPSRLSVDLVAAKKAHLACKKTIPLYVGLATGFCGSFTSFSALIRDAFLAMSNDLVAPGFGVTAESRNGGYSFMAMVAVVITAVALSLGGLMFGAHCAIALEPIIPSFPFPTTRKFMDPLFVLLGWGCWLGAVLMAALPPHDKWRGQVVFALVFSPLGCLFRFYLALWLNGKMVTFPLGTFAANVIGTAVLGMAWDIAHVQSGGGIVGCQVLQGVEDGFCGCLTTVSTWVAELNSLRRQSAYIYGATSVLVSFAVMVAIVGGLRWTDGWSALMC